MGKIKEIMYFPIARYFSFWARLVLKKSGIKIIAITGSTGKSGTFEMAKKLLREANISFQSADHANSAIGIAIYILGLEFIEYGNEKKKYLIWARNILFAPFKSIKLLIKGIGDFEYYIFEIDSDRSREMNVSGKLLSADVVIWLNSSMTHSGNYENEEIRTKIETIANDFSNSIRYMKENGIAILNTYNSMVNKYSKFANGKSIKIGDCFKLEKYDLVDLKSVFDIQINKDYLKIVLNMEDSIIDSWKEQQHIEIPNYILPIYYFYSITSIIALAINLKISNPIFLNSIAKFSLPSGRMNIFEGINKTLLIDSTYNSSSDALIGALKLLSKYQSNIAILGDMRELGNESKEEHEKIGKEIIERKIDKVFLIGPEMSKYTYEYLKKNNFENVWKYSSTKDLKDDLVSQRFSQIPLGSVILLKGSQNTIFLEAITELLLKDRSNAQYLCRRERYWVEKRLEYGL